LLSGFLLHLPVFLLLFECQYLLVSK
jgi:hypothetical protein